MGDLYAQFTALTLMEQRVIALLKEQKLDIARRPRPRDPQALGSRDARGDPRSARTASTGTTAISDGLAEPIRLEMALTVKDDSIVIDYAGSAPQVMRAINVCMAYTFAYTSFGVKAVLAPHIPNNEGVLRPVEITAPLRLDRQFEAARGGRSARADRPFLPDDGDPGAVAGAARARDRDRRLAAVVRQHERASRTTAARSPTCSSPTAATAPRADATARTCCRGRATCRRRRWR